MGRRRNNVAEEGDAQNVDDGAQTREHRNNRPAINDQNNDDKTSYDSSSQAGDNKGDGGRSDSHSENSDDSAPPEQMITILPGQIVKLIVGSAGQKDKKKEHPQDRISKFWSNFEPDYLGGITQILPDSLTDEAVKTSKQPTDSAKTALNSYQHARDTCIKNVKRIIRECRELNQKYTDPHFDIERDLKVTRKRDCLDGLDSPDAERPLDVKRVTVRPKHRFWHLMLMRPGNLRTPAILQRRCFIR